MKVVVIERDFSYEKASTALSMVNARIQFSLKENVEISQYAFKVLENFEEEMAVDGVKPAIFYRREGNLFLYSKKSEASARKIEQLPLFIAKLLKAMNPLRKIDLLP
ncbi:MAG: hypothetical protein HQK69_09885 [Desulfamplus sp.]|nr:hypothetical protein [Desulfamplus sp.]